MTKPYAVVAITKHGTDIARRLQSQLPDVHVYYPERFAYGDEVSRGITAYAGSVIDYVPALFSGYSGLIGIFSIGAMIRLIAPLLKDKRTDPAVVVVDDRAKHVISVLSGHLGGANELTRQVAKALGARPVITTASDVGQTVSVDLLGRSFGWEIENSENVAEVSAAIVNEERVHIIQESGEVDWWPYPKPLPNYLTTFSSLEESLKYPCDASLVITHRLLAKDESKCFLSRGVLYRPKVVVLGVGCNRGTSAVEIESVISNTMDSARLSMKSIRNVATIDLKANEEGLLEVCAKHGWPLITYTAEELNSLITPSPSETVFKYVGAYGVSEPAARLSSGAAEWVVKKVRNGNVTVSICVVSYGTIVNQATPFVEKGSLS